MELSEQINKGGHCVALAGAIIALFAAPEARAFDQALADSLRLTFQNAASNSNLANAFQALAIFGATPGISAATYNVDDNGSKLDMNSYKFAPSHTFDPIYGVKPYIEGTFGYLNTKQNLNFSGFATQAAVDADTFSALGGLGAEVDLAEGLIVRPILLAGYSHTSDDVNVTGTYAGEFDYAGKNLIFDVRISTILLGGALQLEYTTNFSDDINFSGNVRYNHLWNFVLSASDPLLEKKQ